MDSFSSMNFSSPNNLEGQGRQEINAEISLGCGLVLGCLGFILLLYGGLFGLTAYVARMILQCR